MLAAQLVDDIGRRAARRVEREMREPIGDLYTAHSGRQRRPHRVEDGDVQAGVAHRAPQRSRAIVSIHRRTEVVVRSAPHLPLLVHAVAPEIDARQQRRPDLDVAGAHRRLHVHHLAALENGAQRRQTSLHRPLRQQARRGGVEADKEKPLAHRRHKRPDAASKARTIEQPQTIARTRAAKVPSPFFERGLERGQSDIFCVSSCAIGLSRSRRQGTFPTLTRRGSFGYLSVARLPPSLP